ncbi:NUDIX domain-containing protein [Kibdelosporangium banguiense]|uniref:NUDIX domain-containing protein n=1 Tax=Kibdelosporangium banguiense TaxID=1365924 RepID=UPI001FDA81A0|nr:NUDIX hydrolase [Kibdelosporangium banguiense]
MAWLGDVSGSGAQELMILAAIALARVADVSSSQVLPVEQYVAGLNRKRMVAGVLFRDREGRVLLLEPSYKPNWEIPGGAVDADESPWAAAVREVGEELTLEWPLGRLLVVDYVRPQDSRPEGVVFVFDGGVLDQSDVDEFVFSDGEILSAGFYTMSEVRERVKPLLADRIEAAMAAAEQGVTALCEHGRRVA